MAAMGGKPKVVDGAGGRGGHGAGGHLECGDVVFLAVTGDERRW